MKTILHAFLILVIPVSFTGCSGAREKNIPGGNTIDASWKTVLAKCGVDASKSVGSRGRGRVIQTQAPPSETQEVNIPVSGYYKDMYMRFTGFDAYQVRDLRTGTIIPREAINGNIYCTADKTFGRGPFILGKDKKFLVTPTTLCWEVSYPISDLLSGAGIMPTSNVWGIAGKKVTALLAIETTELEVTIPGMTDGTKIHVVVWDKTHKKASEETVVYKAPYKRLLREYDLILIDAV